MARTENTDREDAEQRLRAALPQFRIALEMAKLQGGTVGLAIVSIAEDGSGKLIAKFEGDQFFSDIAEMCGVVDRPGRALDDDGEQE